MARAVPADGSVRRARPSIYDVARAAGVSHMTVSRVLNDHPNIKDSTRASVLEAIDALGYTRSTIARALATRRAMRLGVIVDTATEFGPGNTVTAIQRAARRAGYSVSTFSVGSDTGTALEDGLTELIGQGVEALCLVAPRAASLGTFEARRSAVPTLVVQSEAHSDLLTVAVDQEAGTRLAVQHLLDLGHRSILHLSGPLDWLDAHARHVAFTTVVQEAGLPPMRSVEGDWSSDSGYAVGRDGDLVGDVTAVFASNDQMALGLLHGLHERGVRVPEDVSVVGFDDTPDSRHLLPPLTTVDQDFEALGTLIVDHLLAAIGGSEAGGDRLITPRLVVRESTAAPRGHAPG